MLKHFFTVRTNAASAFDSPNTNSYLFNARSELTSATAAVDSAYRYGYNFDDIGNRTTSSERGTNSVYTASQLNQYTAVDDFTPTYDADGNETIVKTATGIWNVFYNGENRPVRWTQGDTVITMSFDRMGRRVTKDDQRFFYNGYLQIANHHSSTSTSHFNYYIWDPTEPVATRPLAWQRSALGTQHSTLFYTHDGNKNVSEVIASDTDVAAHYEYAPFGALTVSRGASATTNPWRFSSEYAEDDTATVYYNYRHYEPVTGRWMQRDLIGEFLPMILKSRRDNDGENAYLLCFNDSIMLVDQLGLTCIEDANEFPGAVKIRGGYRLCVADGQNGTVALKRRNLSYLIEQMEKAAKRLCEYARDDGERKRKYEGAFDTEFFAGENVQHQYYLIEGQSRVWADNEVNYIGIGMYEAWIGDNIISAYTIVYAWKALKWRTRPTYGTLYWMKIGYGLFNSFYSQLDPCTCENKNGEGGGGRSGNWRSR